MRGEHERALTNVLQSVQKPKDNFAAAGQFGSGRCWLVKDADGGQKVTMSDTGLKPLSFVIVVLLGRDAWGTQLLQPWPSVGRRRLSFDGFDHRRRLATIRKGCCGRVHTMAQDRVVQIAAFRRQSAVHLDEATA